MLGDTEKVDVILASRGLLMTSPTMEHTIVCGLVLVKPPDTNAVTVVPRHKIGHISAVVTKN
jgi:hypothetical protein